MRNPSGGSELPAGVGGCVGGEHTWEWGGCRPVRATITCMEALYVGGGTENVYFMNKIYF